LLPWLAAYTRPRHEEKVKQYCDERGIETFLPCHQSWRRWSDRRKLLQMPLFPSYVFLRPQLQQQRQRAVQAPGFLWFVHNSEGPITVDQHELAAIRVALGNGLKLDPLPNIAVGDAVEITRGALRGFRGFLLCKEDGVVSLRVSAVHGAVRVTLPDPTWVRPVREA
jgi:transcription antitermination factor NusG